MEGNRLPESTRIGAVHLTVNSAERVMGFYRDVLGLHAGPKVHEATPLATADGPPLLWLHERPGAERPPGPRMGLYHLALLLPAREDLGNVLMRLAETGTPLGGASDHLVSEALYLSDPEGNGVEIYADRPRELWRRENGTLQMATVPLDLEDLVRAARRRNRPFRGLPEGSIVGHIHLHVGDLADAGRFFIDGLGFDLMARYGPQAMFVSAGGYHHHIGLNTWAGIHIPPKTLEQPGLRRYELILPDAAAVSRAAEAMEQAGLGVRSNGSERLLTDPTGSEVALRTVGDADADG